MSAFGSGAPVVVGNWKSNGTPERARAWAAAWGSPPPGVAAAVCPPDALAPLLREILPAQVEVGAQDVSRFPEGARTGEAAAATLLSVGCSFALVGHSERRSLMAEDDAVVRAKLLAALEGGLSVLLCVGETQAERERGQADEAVARQLRAALAGGLPPGAGPAPRLAIGYEPVWAIGSGRVPSGDEIAGAHAAISAAARDIRAEQVRIPGLYGGSVSDANAGQISRLPGVDGLLVGGASLDPGKFLEICRQAAAASE